LRLHEPPRLLHQHLIPLLQRRALALAPGDVASRACGGAAVGVDANVGDGGPFADVGGEAGGGGCEGRALDAGEGDVVGLVEGGGCGGEELIVVGVEGEGAGGGGERGGEIGPGGEGLEGVVHDYYEGGICSGGFNSRVGVLGELAGGGDVVGGVGDGLVDNFEGNDDVGV